MFKIRAKRKQIITYEKIFFVLWAVYSTTYFLISASEFTNTYNYDASIIFRFVLYLTLAGQMFCFSIVSQWKVKKMIQYLVLLLIVFLMEVCNTEASFLIYIFFIILAQNMDFDIIIRFDIKLKTVLLFIIMGMCSIGLIDNYSSVINGTYKQSMGFVHPNTFTCFVLIILMEWICVRFKKIKWFEWMIILSIWYVTMKIGGGRASGYAFLLIFCLYITAKIIPALFYSFPVKCCFMLVGPFMTFLSFFLAKLYSQGNTVAIMANEILTNRIMSAANVLETYGITLFGQVIPYIDMREASLTGEDALIVDNAYVHCAVSYGIVFLIFILVMYLYLFYILLKNKRIEMALLSLFFIIMGFGETYMLNVLYNITFLCLLGIKNKENNENKTMFGEQCALRNYKGITKQVDICLRSE